MHGIVIMELTMPIEKSRKKSKLDDAEDGFEPDPLWEINGESSVDMVDNAPRSSSGMYQFDVGLKSWKCTVKREIESRAGIYDISANSCDRMC
jgi:hypothetical protein